MADLISGKVAIVQTNETKRFEADLEKLLERFPHLAEKYGVASRTAEGNWRAFIFDCWFADNQYDELFKDVSRPEDVCEPEIWTEPKNG